MKTVYKLIGMLAAITILTFMNTSDEAFQAIVIGALSYIAIFK